MRALPSANPKICEILRNNNLRITNIKVEILELFLSNLEQKMSVDDIYLMICQKGKKCSIGSIYRSTRELNEKNILSRQWQGGENAKYWLNTEINQQKHTTPIVLTNNKTTTPINHPGLNEVMVEILDELDIPLSTLKKITITLSE